jgi:hypothetical protein
MTLVFLAVYGIVGLVGFFLWFAFPYQEIRGLTYMENYELIIYYTIINLMDIIAIALFANLLYYKRIRTSFPLREGFILGCYAVAFSWLIDIIIYVSIRNTLPTIHEYFLGKNQPEIGIAWLIGFACAVLIGWLETRRRVLPSRRFRVELIISLSVLFLVSIFLTIVGILFFDIRP